MADDAAHGVTDNEGQVHGYPGLYVLDGRFYLPRPASTHLTPSLRSRNAISSVGHSHQGEVVAAGVLHILIPDFLHQLTTFVAPGAENAAASVEAIARFGKLFMGSLWD
ncbi:MAG: hypothetical protein RL701_7594, partial [Pseudomonadota bacterium]